MQVGFALRCRGVASPPVFTGDEVSSCLWGQPAIYKLGDTREPVLTAGLPSPGASVPAQPITAYRKARTPVGGLTFPQPLAGPGPKTTPVAGMLQAQGLGSLGLSLALWVARRGLALWLPSKTGVG